MGRIRLGGLCLVSIILPIAHTVRSPRVSRDLVASAPFSPNDVSMCNFNSHNFSRIDVNYNTNSGLCPCLSNQQVMSPSSIVLPYYNVVNTVKRARLSHRNRETARLSRNLSLTHTWY